jgi:hypothetical protein
MVPRTSATSNHSRLRRVLEAVAIALLIASEIELSEVPTTSVFT